MQPDDALAHLIAAHPQLFHGQQPACWSGLPAGWWPLADALCSSLENLLPPEALARFQVLQIKQKVGGLRFYWRLHGHDAAAAHAIDELVSAACAASLNTCEVCGGQGSPRHGADGCHTRCAPHA